MGEVSVMDDQRPIESLWAGDAVYTVGINGVTRIECYREAGQGGYVPWFTVYSGSFLAVRLSGQSVILTYKGDGPDAF